MKTMKIIPAVLMGVSLATGAGQALAEITVGIAISTTGPIASLGIPQGNTVRLMPTTVGNETIRYIVLDDATDSTKASLNARKLILEEKVDVIIGATTVITSVAVNNVAVEYKVPQIALAPMDVQGNNLYWTFRTVQPNALMASAVAESLKAKGVKRLAFIGQADTFGEQWYAELTRLGATHGFEVIASERYNRTDTNITGQMLHIVAAKPDALVVAAGGTPGALPQLTLANLGVKLPVYQTHAAANADFLRVGGKAVEGTIIPVGVLTVAEQLPDGYPTKASALAYRAKYEAVYGAGSASGFGAQAWDAAQLLVNAAPAALKVAKPGTQEFRKALRDAIEATSNLVGVLGVYSMSPTEHTGLDTRSRVLAHVEKGAWKLGE